MTIELTQFLRPFGHQTQQTTVISDNLQRQYDQMRELGLRLTAEVLSPMSTVSLCIEHPTLGDFDQTIAPNGPQVQVEIERMLLRFSPNRFLAWRAEQEE